MKKTWRKKIFLYTIIGICIGVIIKLFVFDVLIIKGTSMEPAFKEGDIVMLNKLSYGIALPFGSKLITQWASPEPGEVIVYLYNNSYVIKRCLATGRMPLEYSRDNGYTLFVNGTEVPLTELQYHLLSQSHEVPEGTVLAVGDNYGKSHDSRSYGFVPEKNILGKVVCR